MNRANFDFRQCKSLSVKGYEAEIHWRDFLTKDLKQNVVAEIRRIFNAEAKLAEFVKTYEKGAPKLASWAEQNIPEGLTAFSFP